MKGYLTKIFIVAAGSLMMSIGIALYLNAGLGADPLTVFTSGVAHTTGLTVGKASLAIMAVLICVLFFLDRKRIGLGTVLNAGIIGVSVDIFLGLDFLKVNSLAASVIMLIITAVLFGMGVAVYISAGLGEGAVDAIMVLLHNRTKINIRWIKIGLDICLLTLGALLGGKIGAGTVVGVLATGPVIEYTLKLIKSRQHLTS